MNQSRRSFLQASLAMGTVAVAAGAGLLVPGRVMAASWPQQAFTASSVEDGLKSLLGSSKTEASSDIKVDAPDIAENGAVVSVTVDTSLPGAQSISVLIPHNTSPLSAHYLLDKDTDPFVSLRVKMAKTSDLVAVVKSNGKLYSARKPVKVTLGGCGG